MAAFKWVVMLLACNLIGLFDDMWVTTAPVYDSIENQNSDTTGSTSEDMKDDVISNTHGEDAEGISGDETAVKGDGNVINTEGQEDGNGGESGDTDEHPEISSNPHAEGISGDETAEKGDGNVINTEGQEDGNGGESGDTDEHPEISSNPHAEGISGDETAEKGDGNVINTEGQEDGNGGESGDTDELPEISSNPHAEGISGDETAEKGDGNVINTEGQEDGNGGESGDTDEHPEISSNPHAEGISGDETAEKGDGNVINTEGQEDGNEAESGDTDEHPEISSNPHAEGISGDETAEKGDGNVINTEGQEDGNEGESGDTDEHPEISSNPHAEGISGDETAEKGDGNVINTEGQEDGNGGESGDTDEHSASSEQGIDDVDQTSSGSTEAPDSEMVVGVHDNSNLPVSESPVAHLKEEENTDDGGNDNDDDDFNDSESDSAAPAKEEGSTGDQSASVAEHAAEAHETTEEVTSEVNKNESDTDEHDVSQENHSGTETPDDTHLAVGSSSEDGVADQKNSAEGNDSGTSESSTQGSKEEEEEEENEGDSDTDTSGDVHQDTSSEVGTEDQNLSAESNSQIGGSSVKPDTEINAQNFPHGARSYIPLQPSDIITSNDETSTNFNYLTKNTDVPAATEINQTADNESNFAGNATEDRQFGTSDESVVTTSVSGSENKTVFGIQGQKGDIKKDGDGEGINEPGLGTQGESTSSGSIGSYIVLGVIMAIIVMLLGYSVFKGRGRRAQETKNENFGTEMSDVKKNLLPQNEFKGEIQPKTRLEEDESKAKLLPDAQCTGDNVQNGEAGITVQNGVDSWKELGGIDDAPTEKKFDFDKIEAQLEPIDSTENTLNSQNQNSYNPFREAVTPKKQETADGQITHHQSLKTPTHQKAYSNVNGVPEAVVETVPVETYSGYVTQNSRGPAIPYGLQQQNMGTVYSSGPPVKVVTVVEEGCVPTKPVIVNVERNVSQY